MAGEGWGGLVSPPGPGGRGCSRCWAGGLLLSLTLALSDNLSGLGPGGDGASKKLSLNAESLGLSLLSEEAFVSGDGGLVVT